MIKSYCKINLSLRVLKKMKSGLHDIQTNTMLLNLHDLIEIKKIDSKKDEVIFKEKFKKHISENNNSIINTIKILRKNNLIKEKQKFKICIKKKIPVFSGLGGGTSNSAFIIKYFIKKKINDKVLNLFENTIGSDLRLFFNKQVFQKNLRNIKKYKKNFQLYFTLVYPNMKCSTKEIYSKVKKFNKPSNIDYSKIQSKAVLIKLIKKENNYLQKISISKYKGLKFIISFIEAQKDCYYSRMTGSGSVCYGMFKSHNSAKIALKKIKKRFPKYWCVTAKTI
jgi:4-diphosphocytidyl-2-C-methyl-D-erythritol kinase